MIYLFFGSDVERVRSKAFEWVNAARSKEPNLVYVRLTREEISASALIDAAQSSSLFTKRTLTLLDEPFSTKVEEGEDGNEIKESSRTEDLESAINMLAASDNVIVILAPKLSAVKAKKFSAKAKKTYEFNAPTTKDTGNRFNAPLVNALTGRSRERLWLEINRALRAGDAPEAIHGLLHWQARKIMEQGGRNWSREEARSLSIALIALLQDSRRKGLNLDEALERFALGI